MFFNIFERVKQQFGDSFRNWETEQYLSYLYSKILITKDEKENVHLTNLGIEYLTWITSGLPDDKPL